MIIATGEGYPRAGSLFRALERKFVGVREAPPRDPWSLLPWCPPGVVSVVFIGNSDVIMFRKARAAVQLSVLTESARFCRNFTVSQARTLVRGAVV